MSEKLHAVQVRVVIAGHPVDLRAESVPELDATLEALVESSVIDRLAVLTAKASVVEGLSPAAVAPPVAPTYRPAETRQAAPTAATGKVYSGPGADKFTEEQKVCKHGARTHRSGTGAKGPWQALFCPTPKGTPDQCSPEWGRK